MKRFRVMAAALCAVVLLCGFSVPAYAYADGGEGADYGDPTMTEETPAPEPTIEPGEGFSEEGNRVTRDLLYDEHTNKQFITVQTSVGVEPEPEPTETEEPAPEEAEPETGSNTGMLLAVLAVALVGGGAAFYFKVLRPKQQKAAAPQEDYGDELTDYDEPDGYGDEDDDGPPVKTWTFGGRWMPRPRWWGNGKMLTVSRIRNG